MNIYGLKKTKREASKKLSKLREKNKLKTKMANDLKSKISRLNIEIKRRQRERVKKIQTNK